MILKPFLNDMPDVLGLTLEEAVSILDKSGYRKTVKKTAPPTTRNLSNNYRVVRQNIITEDLIELIIAAENLFAL